MWWVKFAQEMLVILAKTESRVQLGETRGRGRRHYCGLERRRVGDHRAWGFLPLAAWPDVLCYEVYPFQSILEGVWKSLVHLVYFGELTWAYLLWVIIAFVIPWARGFFNDSHILEFFWDSAHVLCSTGSLYSKVQTCSVWRNKIIAGWRGSWLEGLYVNLFDLLYSLEGAIEILQFIRKVVGWLILPHVVDFHYLHHLRFKVKVLILLGGTVLRPLLDTHELLGTFFGTLLAHAFVLFLRLNTQYLQSFREFLPGVCV